MMDPASNNIVTAQNKFSSQLYETVIGRQDKSNVVLSPVSIHLALLMISSGANNQTLTELVKGLGIENVPSTVDEWRQAVEPFATTFHSNLNTSILNIANNAFVEKTAALDDQYQQHVKKAFQVDVTQCDFVGNAASETNNINQWIASKTNQMIKDLIKPGILNQLTELVLVNAVHFLGKWKDAFEKNKSYPGTFYGSENTIECKFMSKTDVKTKYGAEGDFHWVTLPFTDEKYNMTIIAVKNKDQQSSLDSWVSERLTKGLDSAFPTTEQKLNRLAFPKFEVDYGLELSETLRNEPFNIKNPFTNQADFSHLIKSTKNENVSLDKIIHKAVFKVDEEGVEASAVTVGLMKSGCKSNGPQFIADSSFAFVLSDDSNKTLLFIGKVNNL